MKIKIAIALVLLFASISAMVFVPHAFAAGPNTTNLTIKIYYDPTTESWALDKKEIDMNDWPLSKEFIDRWSSPTSGINLDSYAEIGKMEFDINNQRWPTGGVSITPAGTFTPHYFDPTNQWDVKALSFRRALAYLTNKPKYITDYLKGYGYQMDTMVPVPALAGYTDYGTGLWGLTNAAAVADAGAGGYRYPYNPAKAATLLDAAGFTIGADGKTRIDPKGEWSVTGHGGDPTDYLKPLVFYIRIDDPNRRQAGEDLAAEMVKVGIPVNKIITERSVCFNQVMVLYNYHIYTGGWSLTADLDGLLYDLYSGTQTGYGYANNYAGFAVHEYDDCAAAVKFAPTTDAAIAAGLQAQWVAEKYIPVIELWAAKGVKAYGSGWTGVVNYDGLGTDNALSFMRMQKSGATTINYGFKSDISALHVISSEWLWDWNVLGLIYDSLIGRNPYNLGEERGYLATNWAVSTWDSGAKTAVTYTLRTGAKFHDGSIVTPEDVRFTFRFTKAAGAGVAWNYASVFQIDHVDTQAQDAGLGANDVKVYFAVKSVWALHWAGFLPIINKAIWTAANTKYSFGYNDATGTMTTPNNVRTYHSWTDDANNNGVIDLKEDGGFSWKFVSYTVGETVALTKFDGYYETGADVDAYINTKFHAIGNVNYGGGYGATQGWYTADSAVDLSLDIRAIGMSTLSSSTWTKEYMWADPEHLRGFNPDADISGPAGVPDGKVDGFDMGVAGKAFGKTQG